MIEWWNTAIRGSSIHVIELRDYMQMSVWLKLRASEILVWPVKV